MIDSIESDEMASLPDPVSRLASAYNPTKLAQMAQQLAERDEQVRQLTVALCEANRRLAERNESPLVSVGSTATCTKCGNMLYYCTCHDVTRELYIARE